MVSEISSIELISSRVA